MYNKLMHCRSVTLIEHNENEHFKNMKTKDVQYLNSLSNESQYLATRCAVGDNVYMFHCLSSGAVESMNKANKDMRARTTVDLLNASMVSIKLECVQFNKMKQEAWGGDSILTPWGKEATFTNLSPNHFIFHLRDYNNHWKIRVFRSNVGGRHEQIEYLSLPLMDRILVHALVWQTRQMWCHVST